MIARTFSSRAFNQDTGGAKKAARQGPVFITDRGRPSHVLLTIEAYEALARRPMSLLDALRDDRPEADFDFEPPRLNGFSLRVPDLD